MIHNPLIKIPDLPFPMAKACITRGNTVALDSIKKQINEFEGRLKQAERSITCVNQKTCHVNDCLNEGLESLVNGIQYLESLGVQLSR